MILNVHIVYVVIEKDSLFTFEAGRVDNLWEHFHMLCSGA